MALIVAIHNGRHSRRDDLADERSFISFAVCKEKLIGNAVIQVKADMDVGLNRTLLIHRNTQFVSGVHKRLDEERWAIKNFLQKDSCLGDSSMFSFLKTCWQATSGRK